ncbi:restriction endonuclease subunit S [Trichocoleus sp. ST-U3]
MEVDDWQELLLGEVLTFQRGFDLPHSKRQPGDIPVVSSSGISGTHSEARVTSPGIVTGRYGTVGEVFFINKDFWPLNTTLFVKNFKGNDPLFISFLLRIIDFQPFSGKSGVPGVNRNDLHSIKVKLPPLPEQKSIAQALSDVDAAIAELDRLITKKRNIKQGTMQQLLTGKKRLPGFSSEWEEKKLGTLADIKRGASPRPIDSPIWYDNSSNVGWVRISDITASNGRVLERTRDYLSDKGIAGSRFLPTGSLIMSICATVGIPVITNIDTCIHDGFVGFSKLNDVDKVFLYYKLKEMENNFRARGQTGSQSNLNSDLVRDCIIQLPTIEEQKAIAQVLTDMDTEIEALDQKRDKYKAIKQGMMQELLTGRTRLV